MAKRLNIPMRSYGSEVGTPTIEELAAWIAEKRGKSGGDLITYQLETSLAAQQPIEAPCAGGLFYGKRLKGALIGVEGGVLVDEPGLDPRDVTADAAALVARKKGIRVAIPAPHLLGVTDGYIGDPEDFSELLSGLTAHLMREMRDRGVQGHVMIADTADEAELERLAGKKCIFLPQNPERFDLELLLEYQSELPILPRQLPFAVERAEEYSIRRLVLINPTSADLTNAAGYFDPDTLLAGGYCTEDCSTYWESLAREAFILK